MADVVLRPAGHEYASIHIRLIVSSIVWCVVAKESHFFSAIGESGRPMSPSRQKSPASLSTWCLSPPAQSGCLPKSHLSRQWVSLAYSSPFLQRKTTHFRTKSAHSVGTFLLLQSSFPWWKPHLDRVYLRIILDILSPVSVSCFDSASSSYIA